MGLVCTYRDCLKPSGVYTFPYHCSFPLICSSEQVTCSCLLLRGKKKSCCTITELDLLEHRYRPRKKPHAIKQKYSIYLAQLQGVSGNNLILHIHTAHHKLSAYTSEKMAKNTFPQFPHCCFCLANFKTYEGKAESVLLHCPQRKLIQGCWHKQMPVSDSWLSVFVLLPRKAQALIPCAIKPSIHTCKLLTSKVQVIGDGPQKRHMQVLHVLSQNCIYFQSKKLPSSKYISKNESLRIIFHSWI